MPVGIGNTLSTKAGPLPVWAWAGLGTAALGGYLYYRRKSAAAQQTSAQTDSQGMSGTGSNLGTVPISNLTTAAQPMPIQMGDTFVDVQPQDITQTQTQTQTTTPLTTPSKPTTPKPPTATLKPAPKPTPPPPKQTTMQVCKWPGWCGSLWGIAQHYYGNGALWPNIYNANKAKIGANPNLIYAGTTLIIPPK